MALTKDEIVQELDVSRVDTGPLASGERIHFGGEFEEVSFGRCRRSHAEGALRHPDAIAAYEPSDTRFVVATKTISTTRPPFVLLVVARLRRGSVEVFAGWRLHESEPELEDLARDPTQALATFFDRYAIEHDAAGVRSKFSSILLEPLSSGGPQSLVSAATSSDKGIIHAAMKKQPDHFVIAWPFVIDGNAYLADVARGGL